MSRSPSSEDVPECGSLQAPCFTLQYALKEIAIDLDNILLDSTHEYFQNTTLDITKQLTLDSYRTITDRDEQMQRHYIIINSTLLPFFNISSSNVTIQNITFRIAGDFPYDTKEWKPLIRLNYASHFLQILNCTFITSYVIELFDLKYYSDDKLNIQILHTKFQGYIFNKYKSFSGSAYLATEMRRCWKRNIKNTINRSILNLTQISFLLKKCTFINVLFDLILLNDKVQNVNNTKFIDSTFNATFISYVTFSDDNTYNTYSLENCSFYESSVQLSCLGQIDIKLSNCRFMGSNDDPLFYFMLDIHGNAGEIRISNTTFEDGIYGALNVHSESWVYPTLKVVIQSCIFLNNTVLNLPFMPFGRAGAITVTSYNLVIKDTEFHNNSAAGSRVGSVLIKMFYNSSGGDTSASIQNITIISETFERSNTPVLIRPEDFSDGPTFLIDETTDIWCGYGQYMQFVNNERTYLSITCTTCKTSTYNVKDIDRNISRRS